MKKKQCPLCSTELEQRNVAPCWDCGHAENELEELKAGEHTYAEYCAFGIENLILCDFCDADFGSYLPEYFALPNTGYVIPSESLQFVKDIVEPREEIDLYCSECNHRLIFIKFRESVLGTHSNLPQQGFE